MAVFIKSRWVLFLVLIVFIICKIPHLHYPYYWDESWPYASSIYEMYKHGPSLLPTALDPDLSRGHPLLFHAAAAVWMNIFGTSHVSVHSFALCIAVLLLISVYEAGLRLFNERVATLSLFLVSTLLAFFVHSSFVLPEVLVALFCFLSLVFYVCDRYILTAIALTALFYTKESGLIMGFVLGMDALIGLFRTSVQWRIRLSRIVSVAIPCVLIAAFFLYQEHIRGWFIFPLHNKLIDNKWEVFWYHLRINGLKYTFSYRLKEYYFLLVLELALIAFIKNRNVKYLAPFIPALVIYLLVYDIRENDPSYSRVLLASLVTSFVVMFYLLRSLKIYTGQRQQKIAVLSIVFVLLFVCFSSMNFFTYRYLFAVIIPLFFFIATVLDKFIERTFPVLFYPVLAAILTISYYSFKGDTDFKDTDPGAFDAMDVQQKEVDFILQHRFSYTSVGAASFLTLQHLILPETGFLHGEKPFNHKTAKWVIDGGTDYVLFDNIEPDYRYHQIDSNAFHMVYRYQKGSVWTEIFQVR